MKIKLIGLQLLFFPFFGLISCAPDTKSDEYPSREFKVEIINIDQSRFSLRGLNHVSVSSTIDLGVSKADAQKLEIQSTATCQATDWPEPAERILFFSKKNQFIIRDLLPIALFDPSLKEEIPVYCDFQFKIMEHQNHLSQLELKQIQVKGLEEDNFSLSILNDPTIHYYLLSEIKTTPIVVESTPSLMTILCDQTKSHLLLTEKESSYDLILKNLSFENSNLLHCRFILENKTNNSIQASRSFYLQKDEPKLQTTFHSFFSGELNPILPEQKLAEIRIKNKGKSPIYIAFKDFYTGLTPIPIYSSLQSPIGFYKKQSPVSALWMVVSQTPKRKMSSEETTPIYILSGQEELVIELIAAQALECNSGLVDNQNQFVDHRCETKHLLTGLFYNIEKFPKIKTNLWNNDEQWQWIKQDLTGLQPAAVNNRPLYWSPNRNIKNICSKHSVIKEMKADLIEAPFSYFDIKGCRVY